MDAKLISFGETALDRLVQWLRSNGEPKELAEIVKQYLEILNKSVMEDSE